MFGNSVRQKVLTIVKSVQYGRGRNLSKMYSSPPSGVFPYTNWSHSQVAEFSHRSFSLFPGFSERFCSPVVNSYFLRELHTENRGNIIDQDMEGFHVDLQACGRALNKLQIHEEIEEKSKVEGEIEMDEFSKTGDDNLTSTEDTVLRNLLKLIPQKHAPLQCLRTNVRLLLDLGVHPMDAIFFLKRHHCFQVYDASNELLEKAKLLKESYGNPSLIVRLKHPLKNPTVLSGVLNFLSSELQLSKSEMLEILHDENSTLLNENVQSLQKVLSLLKILQIPNIKKSFAKFLQYSKRSPDWAKGISTELKNFLPEDDLGPVIQRFPKILSCPPHLVESNSRILGDIFGSEKSLIMVKKNPSILVAASTELEDRLLELMIKFGTENALQMASGYPGILCVSWDRIRPKLDFLTVKMGRSLVEVVRCPTFLTRSLEHCIIPRFLALGENSRGVGLSHMFGCSITVFSKRFKHKLDPEAHKAATVAKQETTLDFLLEKFGELGTNELLKKLPKIINCDVRVLSPKFSYLVGVMGYTMEELLLCPLILSRSLERCIIPRHKILGTKKRRLSYAYCSSNAKFEDLFGIKLPSIAYLKTRPNPNPLRLPSYEVFEGKTVQS